MSCSHMTASLECLQQAQPARGVLQKQACAWACQQPHLILCTLRCIPRVVTTGSLSVQLCKHKHLEDCCRLSAWACQEPHLILCILGSILRILGILGSGVVVLLLRTRGGCVVLLCRVLLPLVPVGCLLLRRHGIVLLLRHLASLFGNLRV